MVAPHQANASEVYQGDDGTVTFWQLPLWIKLFYLTTLLAALAGLLKFLPFVQGKIDDLLENQNRHNILQYVYTNPGSTIAQVSQDQNIERATVKYHLQKLETGGKIVLRKMGKYSRIFKNSGAFSDAEKAVIGHLQNKTSRSILAMILENPGITNQELSERLGIAKSAVHWHIEKFSRDNIIGYHQDVKFKKYFINSNMASVLLKHLKNL